MISRTISIAKEYGADIIPYLVQSACHYESALYMIDGSKKINMKSIMGMTILQLKPGAEYEILADGTDEKKAVDEIAGCFEMK